MIRLTEDQEDDGSSFTLSMSAYQFWETRVYACTEIITENRNFVFLKCNNVSGVIFHNFGFKNEFIHFRNMFSKMVHYIHNIICK